MPPAIAPPAAVAPPAHLAPEAARLDARRGARRVVLVFAPDGGDARLRYQRGELARLLKGPDTRDIDAVMVIGLRTEGASDPASNLRERFHVVEGGYRTLLIGKDGHVALRSSNPIPAEELARAIDAMPMRQAEMRR